MRRRSAARAAFWALCVLAPVLAWCATNAHAPLERSSGPRPPAAHVESVVVLSAARLLADGTQVEVELTRLHAEPGEQNFDAAALARRLSLEPGEPWHLRLARRAALDPSAARVALVWEGAALSIVDERGPCCTPPTSNAPTTPTSRLPADPLRTLLAPGAGELAVGTSQRIFLWGREPGPGAHLLGLFPEPIALAAENLARREFDSALARLPAPKAKGEDERH